MPSMTAVQGAQGACWPTAVRGVAKQWPLAAPPPPPPVAATLPASNCCCPSCLALPFMPARPATKLTSALPTSVALVCHPHAGSDDLLKKNDKQVRGSDLLRPHECCAWRHLPHARMPLGCHSCHRMVRALAADPSTCRMPSLLAWPLTATAPCHAPLQGTDQLLQDSKVEELPVDKQGAAAMRTPPSPVCLHTQHAQPHRQPARTYCLELHGMALHAAGRRRPGTRQTRLPIPGWRATPHGGNNCQLPCAPTPLL